jgi:hypothetical protein
MCGSVFFKQKQCTKKHDVMQNVMTKILTHTGLDAMASLTQLFTSTPNTFSTTPKDDDLLFSNARRVQRHTILSQFVRDLSKITVDHPDILYRTISRIEHLLALTTPSDNRSSSNNAWLANRQISVITETIDHIILIAKKSSDFEILDIVIDFEREEYMSVKTCFDDLVYNMLLNE